MSNLPKYYFGDIPAEVMHEIAAALPASDGNDFSVASCESRIHREHRGELWQCAECLRVFCWAEDADDSALDLCDHCWARLHASRRVVAFA